MNLHETISQLVAHKGMTSSLYLLQQNEFEAAMPHQRAMGKTREEIQEKIKEYQFKIDDCRSDAAYWGYLAELTYWQTVDRLHQVATLLGPDQLPDVEIPHLDGAYPIMDIIAKLETFGLMVYHEALKIQKNAQAGR